MPDAHEYADDRSGDPGSFDRHGVIGIVTSGQLLLVIRRAQCVIAPGKLCFPGGGIESGESEPDALIREFREELDVSIRPIEKIHESVTPWNVHLVWWTADLSDADSGGNRPDIAFRPNPDEVEEIHWMTLDELIDSPDLLESNLSFLLAVREGRILVPGVSPDAI